MRQQNTARVHSLPHNEITGTRSLQNTASIGGADSQVVKSLDCGARVPGFESRCRRKVLGSDGIICKYLPL